MPKLFHMPTGPDRRLPRTLLGALLALSLSQGAMAGEKPGRKAPDTRPDYTAAQAATARPEGLPASVRIAGDDVAAFRALIESAGRATDPWLVLSGGGENGAFAAGLLAGWSERGDRPAFGVITGVSTGALIAPFAFVGPQADAALRTNYTEISAADVFEFGATRDSLTDTWPLKERIERGVTPALLKAVAAEHAKGRRLLIATTQVDSERPVLWDMGAIATRSAASGDPRALKLFREIVLASTAVPGVFPPVLIPATSGDKTFEEMHDDGGAMSPYFLAPAAAVSGEAGLRLPARKVYLVINNRLDPEFQMAGRSTLSVLGRTMSAAIKAQTRAALALTRAYAQRTDLDLRIAQIDGRFGKTSEKPFDQPYMQALFAHGQSLGRDGTAFADAPAPRREADRTAETGSVGALATSAAR
ncbi:patatin-like phospholipase family protein [Methylobacterium sp. Leaf118]|uniref:patatin-like phospholipase family protein n=1 Tax=Methylobacterium sp. Leaf118 TaxID=2876562 RepID=UPI001E4212F5|nr:patatin-like phospholipase family protein [Methylobacterium sp. Leaf118]